VSTLDHTLKPEAATARRLEIITGTGRRRWFNNGGQLGDGTNTSRSSPIQVGTLTDWATFAVGQTT
jgi:hypothetical protein